MENQSNNSILFDYELEVDGVIYRELKSLNREVIQDGPEAGKEEQVLVHTRSIGDKSYTVKKSDPSNEETEEVVEGNNWTSDEKRAFLEDWDKNWNPSLKRKIYNYYTSFDQPKEGGVIGFFKKMFGYEYHIVVSDNRLEVDGVTYRELRTLTISVKGFLIASILFRELKTLTISVKGFLIASILFGIYCYLYYY